MGYHPLLSLRDVRKLLNYSPEDMAKRIAVTVTSYLRHERGERRIYWDKVLTLAGMLDVDPRVFARPLTDVERLELWHRGEDRRKATALVSGEAPPAFEVQGDDGMPEAEPASEAKPSLDELLADWAEDPA